MAFVSPGGGGGSLFALLSTAAKDINASGATANVPIFTLTGSVWLAAIWLEVTDATDLTNHTAGHFRLNDQTAQVDISESATGLTLSGAAVGSIAVKNNTSSTAALAKGDASVGAIIEPSSEGLAMFTPIAIVKKNGATTQVEYRYTTTDAPANAKFMFHCLWRKLSDDGALVAA